MRVNAPTKEAQVRSFETGATRSADAGRYDPEGFLSPIVIERFAEYMQKHRLQPDGSVRASDNWQKGMPLETYMKGMWRHFLHLWTRYRGFEVQDKGAAADIEEDLCALLFNVQGMLFETLKVKRRSSAGISGIIGAALKMPDGVLVHRNEQVRKAFENAPALDPRARIAPGRVEEWRDHGEVPFITGKAQLLDDPSA